jgi:hypothetical protein
MLEAEQPIETPLEPSEIAVSTARKAAVKATLRAIGMTLTAVNKLDLTDEGKVRREVLKAHGCTEAEYRAAGGRL